MPIFLAGDSSGGGLAIAVSMVAHPRGVVAFSPWADLTCSGETMATNADQDIECTRESLEQMAGWYANGHPLDDPRLSPALSPAGIPPLIAFVGSDEVLLSDARRVTAGEDAEIVVGDGMQHIWPIWVGAFPEAGSAMAHAGEWVRHQAAVA